MLKGQKPGQPTDDIPHDVNARFDPPRATEHASGVTLFTKVGSATGNAIIVRELPPPSPTYDYLKKTNQKLWLVETDFGNRMRLTDNEIIEMFEIGHQQDYDIWWEGRINTIEKTVD